MDTIENKSFNILESENLLHFPIDVNKLAHNLEIKIFEENMEDNISGLLYLKNGTPYIGVNSSHHPNRKRFTIAHELGHYVLHHPKDNDVIVDKKLFIFPRAEELSSGYEKEKEANKFAASLLMPKALLERIIIQEEIDLDDDNAITKLSEIVLVSEQALTYRLLNLGFISCQ